MSKFKAIHGLHTNDAKGAAIFVPEGTVLELSDKDAELALKSGSVEAVDGDDGERLLTPQEFAVEYRKHYEGRLVLEYEAYRRHYETKNAPPAAAKDAPDAPPQVTEVAAPAAAQPRRPAQKADAPAKSE